MLARTGTIVRKHRRRSSTTSRHGARRESTATPSPSVCPTPSPSPSFSLFAYDHGGQYSSGPLPPNTFPIPFLPSESANFPNAHIKAVTFSFDVRQVNSQLGLNKISPVRLELGVELS
ncbi:unnamed protein product, partial [Candidula unifasciata]